MRLVPKGEFGRHVFTLITGATVAQFIPVVASPLLTRLYTPADFGALALFMSLSVVLSSVATGRYEFAILSPKQDEDAINIGALAMAIALAFTIVIFLVVAVFGGAIARALNNPGLANWLFLLPLTVLAQAFLNVLKYLNSRKKHFKDIASAGVYKATVSVIVQLSVAFMVSGAAGLILGFFMAAIFANMRLLRNVGSADYIRSVLSVAKMKSNGKEYIDFPKYSSWSGLANTLASNLTNMLLSVFYSSTVLGFYSMAQRLLGLPTALVGTAISQVFLQKASQEKHERGHAAAVFKQTLARLAMIGLPIFCVAYFLVEDVFVLVFGEPWRTAGVYARILMPLFAVRFIAAPLTMMNVVDKKNKTGMLANFALLTITASVITYSGRINLPITQMLHIFTFSACIYYVLYVAAIYRQTMRTAAQSIERLV